MPAGTRRERGQHDRLEVAHHGNERERGEHEGREPDQDGGPASRPAPPQGPGDERRDDDRTERAADSAGHRLVPAADRIADAGSRHSRSRGNREHERPAGRNHGGKQAADADPEAEREADSVPLPHLVWSVDRAREHAV